MIRKGGKENLSTISINFIFQIIFKTYIHFYFYFFLSRWIVSSAAPLPSPSSLILLLRSLVFHFHPPLSWCVFHRPRALTTPSWNDHQKSSIAIILYETEDTAAFLLFLLMSWNARTHNSSMWSKDRHGGLFDSNNLKKRRRRRTREGDGRLWPVFCRRREGKGFLKEEQNSKRSGAVFCIGHGLISTIGHGIDGEASDCAQFACASNLYCRGEWYTMNVINRRMNEPWLPQHNRLVWSWLRISNGRTRYCNSWNFLYKQ